MLENIIKKIKRLNIKKRTLYCLAIGIIFAILSFFINRESIYENKNKIKREEFGLDKTPYSITIDVENLAKDLQFDISVSAKKYTIKEADKIFNQKFENLLINMLGNNIDYEHINKKMNFIKDLGDGIKASYSFTATMELDNDNLSSTSEIKNSNIGTESETKEKNISTKSEMDEFDYFVKYQNVVDGNGNINNENFSKTESCNGFINIVLSTEVKELEGIYKSNKFLVPITVIGKEMSQLEEFKVAFKNEIKNKDKETIDKNHITLPTVVNNFRIIYKDKVDFSFLIMIVLGILAAILLEGKDKEKIKEEKKKRERTLVLDYGQIITKILLYISSGMTIRNAIIKLADQYSLSLMKDKNKEKRCAYDEMVIVKNKLNSGYNEIKAYEEMAQNIDMRIYTRFLNILIQSIKNGNKELKNILNMEVQDALYERKQRAKKMGEEATTKLILPLMMMLAIIMIVIMMPAFMGM